MFYVVVVIALLLSAVLVVMVLLQPSKGGGVGGAFGNMGSSLGQTFGSRRMLDFLSKWTMYVAGGLALLCLLANIALNATVQDRPRGETPVTSGRGLKTTPQAAPMQQPLPGAQAPAAGQQAPAGQAPAAGQQAPAGQAPAAGQQAPAGQAPAGQAPAQQPANP